jgi:hypothetical protein
VLVLKILRNVSNICSYILDTVTELYVWVGNKSNQEQRKAATAYANELLGSRKGRPTWVEVTRILQNTGLAAILVFLIKQRTDTVPRKILELGNSSHLSCPSPSSRKSENHFRAFQY